jgi:hypothetical protein
MRPTTSVAAAVAGILGFAVAGGAQAAAVPQGSNYALRVVIAGSSAAQGTFVSIVKAACSADFTTYNAAGATVNYNAYACTLLNNAALKTAAGKLAIFYYRPDGGSVTGVGAFSPGAPGFTAGKGAKINRLDDLSGGCALAGQTFTCTIGGTYNGNTDAAATGLTKDFVDLGVSDLEPGAFVGENWGTAFPFIGSPQPKTTLNAIPHTAVFDQVFTLLASNTGPTAGLTSIKRQDAANIFSGNYFDWSQVDDGTGNALTAGEIVVCRRDAGSGTQAGASIVFNDTGCNGSAKPFVTNPSINGNTVIINLSTGNVNTCVGTHDGSIGFVVTPAAAPAGTHLVSIDGVAGNQTNAALGKYPWLFELTFNHPVGQVLPQTEADFISFAQAQLAANATDPASSNIVSIPGTGNPATLPLHTSATNHIPVALGTRGGDSCADESNQN